MIAMGSIQISALLRQVFLVAIVAVVFTTGCKKRVDNGTAPVVPTVDPAVANTIGFFLNDWKPKSIIPPSYTDTTIPAAVATVAITIDPSNIITKVPLPVFGHNANVWMTQMVTEPVLINHITHLKPGVVRYPGGSISDKFFWNAPKNVRPADAPDSLQDAQGMAKPATYWFGRNTDNWTLSVDNYYNMLQQTGSQGIITVNYSYARYGTGTNPVATAAHLAANWVRYDNGRTKYWEVGNENYGTWEEGYRIDVTKNKDGQPEYGAGSLYAQHAKVFIDSMRKAAQQIGKTIFIGVQLFPKASLAGAAAIEKNWNTGVLSNINNTADYFIIHNYFTARNNVPADVILNTAVDNPEGMMNFVKTAITNAGATIKPIALTEWNIVPEGSMQMVSYINGIHSAIVLGEALKHKYGETSRWDFANGWNNGNDHGILNSGDEPGVSKWNPRPPFYYMYYFQKFTGDRLVETKVSGSADVVAYGSTFTSGQKGLVIANKGTTAQTATVALANGTPGNRFYWYTLTGGTDNGDFSRRVFVNGKGPTEISGGPATTYATMNAYSASTQNGIKISVPARSVIYVLIDK